jgi:hypothetical protein
MKFILDTECYSNYWCVYLKELNGSQTHLFERFDDQPLNRRALFNLMGGNTTISFNGIGYDLPLIALALTGATNKQLKALSDTIINSDKPAWMVLRDFELNVPAWDHIDLMELAIGQASLKIYGGRLHAPKMQDLPIEPDAVISNTQRKQLVEYCFNDLETTELLYNELKGQVALREQMSETYGVDLRSKSDAQIAEALIKSELEKLTGKQIKKPTAAITKTYRYRNPRIISFESKELGDIFSKLLDQRFEVMLNGSIKMPEWLAKTRIKMGRSEYQMGIGGLHSCEKSQAVTPNTNQLLFDADVASMYPSIILQQNLAPESLGRPFLQLYKSIVQERLAAKKAGNKVVDSTYKIVLNGSFGKFGSKYSILYSPDLLIQTTITGQLSLLMLIEQLEKHGMSVVSANTDGIVTLLDKSQRELYEELCFDWMLKTSYTLEFAEYAALYSRDVNNYVALKKGGGVKRKGAFATGSLAKNPENLITFDAVCDYLEHGIAIEQTIKACDDLRKFVTIRKVTGGAKWRDELLGKAVRFYYSNQVPKAECIRYVKNGNKVPNSDGAKPAMQLPAALPNDVDYDVYIQQANELLTLIGAKNVRETNRSLFS